MSNKTLKIKNVTYLFISIQDIKITNESNILVTYIPIQNYKIIY